METNEKNNISAESMAQVTGGAANINTEYALIQKGFCPKCGKQDTMEYIPGGFHCSFCNFDFWL